MHVSFSLNGTAHVAKENKPTIVSDIVDFFLSSVGATLTEMKDVELRLVILYIITYSYMTLRYLIEMSLWSNYNNSHCQHSACKRAHLMSSHVNIYFCWSLLQKGSLENIAMIFLYVRIEIIFLLWIITTNTWYCQADANINSLWLCSHELILCNLPSNIMH